MLSVGFLLQGRYRIVRELGSGGFATVYLAEDVRLGGRYIAVKEFDASRLPAPDQGWARQHFQNEAQVLSQLHHESIANVTDFFSSGGLDYLVMEYVPGETLSQTWQRMGGRIHHNQVLTWARELCRVLDYLHQQNPPIIFRDLKPDNIMVQSDGCLKVIDFGIVRHFKPGQTRDTQVLGTPGYAAPEQYGQRQTDTRSDIYSLAAVLHQLLTGHDPTQTPMNFPNLLTLSPQVPPHIATAIHRALDTNPDQRFPQVRDFAVALGVSITGSKRMGPVVSHIPRKTTRSWAGPVLGGLMISIVIGFLVWGDISASTATLPTAVVSPQVVTVMVTSAAKNTPPDSSTTLADTRLIANVTLAGSTETAINPVSSSAVVPTEISLAPATNPIVLTSVSFPVTVDASPTAQRVVANNVLQQFIPGGEFVMGSTRGNDDETEHKVYLDPYWIDQTEVTNYQFALFVADTGYVTSAQREGSGWTFSNGREANVSGANWQHPYGPESSTSGQDNYPVVLVSWDDAFAYCSWRGGALPTEAQWEKAARGTEGHVYPWGNEFDCSRGNFDDERELDATVVGADNCDGFSRIAPVGSFPSGSSDYGVLDMSGNAWEWVADWYESSYYVNSPYMNPMGPIEGEFKVLRGGGWTSDEYYSRASHRSVTAVPSSRFFTVGFRCMQN